MNKKLSTWAWRWVTLPFLVVALLLGVAGPAQAVDIGHSDLIAAGEVVNDDVVLFGTTTRMDGTVNGTLLASGQDVVINGTVNGDVIIWTNTATINGVINGNLYAAGGALTLNGPVKGTAFLAGYSFDLGPALKVDRNLFFVGFSLTAEPGSQVGTDLLATGYQGAFAGSIGRDVLADLGALELTGQVGRNVKVTVAEPSNDRNPPPAFTPWPGKAVRMLSSGLRVSDKASIGGKLTYNSAVNQDSAIQATPAEGTEYVYKANTEKTQTPARADFASTALATIVAAGRDFLTLMALGSLAVAFWPRLVTRVVEKARQKALPAAGWGIVVFFAAYSLMAVMALILLVLGILLGVVTFGGLAQVVFGVGFSALGLAGTGFSLLVSYGSKLVVAALVGQVLLRSVAPQLAENRYWGLALGVLIYAILRDLPGIVPVVGPLFGWLVGTVVTVVGLGAIWLVFRDWRSAAQAAPAEATVPVTPPAG